MLSFVSRLKYIMLLNLPIILSSNSFSFYLSFLLFILIYSLPKVKNQAAYNNKLYNAPSVTLCLLYPCYTVLETVISLFVESKHC